MNTVKMVAVFAENRPGQAARITGILSRSNINIRYMTVASSGAYGVMKLLVNDPVTACKEFTKAGLATTLIDAVAVNLPDKPGALHVVADCLAQHDINLSNTGGFASRDQAILVLEVEDPARVSDILLKQGLHVLTHEETVSL